MATVAELVGELKINTKSFESSLDSSVDKMSKANSRMSRIGDRIGNVFQTMGKVAVAGVTGIGISLVGLGVLGVKLAADYETLGVALQTSLGGSAEAADKALSQITDFAKKTPFQVQEITEAFIKLNNYGLKTGEEALTSYGDTASAMGKSLDQMIEAVADATAGEFERLKEFGIRSSVEGDRVKFTFRGITTEVGKNAEEIEDYLINLGQTQFAGGMEAQSETLNGRISTLKDTFNLLLIDIVNSSGVFDIVSDAVERLSGFIENNRETIINFINTGVTSLIELLKDMVYWLYENKDSIIDFIKNGVDLAISAFQIFKDDILPPVITGITILYNIFSFASEIISKFWGNLETANIKFKDFIQNSKLIQGAITVITTPFKILNDQIKFAIESLKTLKNSLSNTASSVSSGLGGFSGTVLGKLPKFATGGVVGGNSFTGDNIIARLNSGEEVVTREDRQSIKDFIASLMSNMGGTRGEVNVYNNFEAGYPQEAASGRIINDIKLNY